MEGDRMNGELLEEVRSKMPMEDDLLEVAELFKVFGDLTRVKIICALSK